MPFEPGQSGNPRGTAGPKRFRDALERALAQDDGKKLRLAVDKMLDAASDGEAWAINFLADRLDGKPHQSSDISNPDGTNLFSAIERRIIDHQK
jgi:hypothetical protein